MFDVIVYRMLRIFCGRGEKMDKWAFKRIILGITN